MEDGLDSPEVQQERAAALSPQGFAQHKQMQEDELEDEEDEDEEDEDS
jgi:hypothetical protein